MKLANKTNGHRIYWWCRCSCDGKIIKVKGADLHRRGTQSCGCLQKERARQANGLRPYEALYNRLAFDCKRRSNKRAKLKLTYKDFLRFAKINKCHYCRSAVYFSAYTGRGSKDKRASNLDRKDNNKGYTKENCVVCCPRCNGGKSDLFTYREWRKMTRCFREERKRGR